MSTNAEKMIDLVRTWTCYGVPKNATGLCIVRDEHGEEHLKLGFDAHRDCITAIGYEASPETGVDVCASLAALCLLALNQPVMTAYNLSEADLCAGLSDNGSVDEANRPAIKLAMTMLREAIRVYANTYTEKNAQGEDWHGNS